MNNSSIIILIIRNIQITLNIKKIKNIQEKTTDIKMYFNILLPQLYILIYDNV